jgi:hypothetical protein
MSQIYFKYTFPYNDNETFVLAKNTKKYSNIPINEYLTEKLIYYGTSKKSTVGTINGNIVDKKIRKSKTINDVTLSISTNIDLDQLYNDNIKNILPTEIQSYANNVLKFNTKWDLLLYSTGGKFAKHTDGSSCKDHYATLLLFPPKKYNIFTGGELIIYDTNTNHVTIGANDLHDVEWTVIGFPINVYHEVKPILSGIRYTFRSIVKIDGMIKFLAGLPNIQNTPLPYNNKDADSDIKNINSKIVELQKKIDKYTQEINNLKMFALTDNIINITNKISSDNHEYIFILLDRNYKEPLPSLLLGEDKILYNHLITLYTKLKMINLKNLSHKFSDYKEGGYYTIDEDLEEIIDSYNYTIISKKNGTNYSPGDIIKEDNVYNDETYDNVHVINVTALIISK